MSTHQLRIYFDQRGWDIFIIVSGHFRHCKHKTVYISAHRRRKWGTRR